MRKSGVDGQTIVFRRGDDGIRGHLASLTASLIIRAHVPPPPVEGKKEWPGQKFNYNGLV